jgi:hypothetical protein
MPQDTTRLNSQPGTRLASLMKMSPLGQAALREKPVKADADETPTTPAWNKQDRRRDESGDNRVQLFSELPDADKSAILDQLKAAGCPMHADAGFEGLPLSVLRAVLAELRKLTAGRQMADNPMDYRQSMATAPGTPTSTGGHSSFSEGNIRRMTEDHRPVFDLHRIVTLRNAGSIGTIRAK